MTMVVDMIVIWAVGMLMIGAMVGTQDVEATGLVSMITCHYFDFMIFLW